jgi:tetratricopeptide (TPR) repeat protein
MLDSMDLSTMSKSERMHAELLRGKAMNKAYVNFTTDSVMLEVVDWYERHGNANQKMLAYYILGCAYRDLGSAPKALEAYRDAIERADTTDEECDFRQLMLIHSQMANVYGTMYASQSEECELNNALRYASHIQDRAAMCAFNDLKCASLYKNKKYYDCIRMTDSLRQVYMQHDDTYNASLVCVNGFKSYLALGKYDSAHVYLENYAKIFNTDVSVRNIRGGKDALPILRGDYYLCTNKPDSALLYYRTVDLHKLIPTVRSYLYCNISTSYKMLSQTDSAYKYLALHAELMDKCYDSSVAEACINAQQLYDYGIEQKIAKQKSAEASLVKTYLIWTLIAIIILVTLLLYIRYRNLLAQKEAADLRIAHNNAMDSLRSAEVQLNILTSQKDEVEKLLVEETIKSAQYNDELSSINKDIIAKSTEIHKLKSMISQYEKMIEPDKYTDANELLCQSEAVHQFRKSLTAKGSSIDSCHWTKLQNTIRHLFPNFESQINKDGKLSKNDLQVCMLVKARFSPSEIEYIMNMKHSYATNARKRLHNTIFGFPGSGEEFDKKILFIK